MVFKVGTGGFLLSTSIEVSRSPPTLQAGFPITETLLHRPFDALRGHSVLSVISLLHRAAITAAVHKLARIHEAMIKHRTSL